MGKKETAEQDQLVEKRQKIAKDKESNLVIEMKIIKTTVLHNKTRSVIRDQNKNLSLVSCRYVGKEYKTQGKYKLLFPQTASQNLTNGHLRTCQVEE